MSVVKTELRPAWRTYWSGFLLMLLLLAGAFFAFVSAAPEEEGMRLLALAMLAAAGLVLLGVVLKRYSWKFTIEGNRVSRHYGLISRNQQSVRIGDLRSIELDQSFFQRVFGVGDIAFYSAGSADAEVRFFGIADPLSVRNQIDAVMDAKGDGGTQE